METATLVKLTGLNAVKFSSPPTKYKATEMDYLTRNQNAEGELLGEFSDNIIPGATMHLVPHWNKSKGTYWSADIKILKEIMEEGIKTGKLQIRYPKNFEDSDKAGKIIKFEDVRPDNFLDPFFNSEELQTKKMEKGKYAFDLENDLVDRILFHSYRTDPRTEIKNGQYKKSAINPRFRILLSESEKMEDKAELEKEVNLLSVLSKLPFEEKKKIARVAKIRMNDIENPDPDDLFITLLKEAKGSNQDKLIELTSISREDLDLLYDVERGIDYRIITVQRDKFHLNEEPIQNVKTKNDLINHLKDIENSGDRLYLTELIGERTKDK